MTASDLAKHLGPECVRDLLLSIGTHKGHRPLSPAMVAAGLQRAIDAGFSRVQVASALHLDGTSMVGRFLNLLRLSDDIVRLVDWGVTGGGLSFSAAHEIVGLASPSQREYVARAAVEYRLTKSEVIEVVQLVRRSDRSAEESLRLVVEKRPSVERIFVLVGSVTDPSVSTALEAIDAVERSSMIRRAVEAGYPDGALLQARLEPKKFILVGDAALQKAMVADEAGWENALTRFLKEAI